jgi:hypothetical protein
MSPAEYLVDRDAGCLYEVVSRRTVENYGLRRGVIRYVVVRDVVTEQARRVGPLELALLDPVRTETRRAA